MPAALIAVFVIAVAVLLVVWLITRSSRSSSGGGSGVELGAPIAIEARAALPPQGILVAESVLQSSGSSPDFLWSALEAAAAPLALEYYPVSESELTRYRSIPINAAAQQAMVKVVEAVNPNAPTLFRAVLPKGAELVKAVGVEGFRGFSRTGGKTAHAVLKPVAVSGVIAAGWPVLAVAGTVMAVDMAAQCEQRAHQRRVEASLARQDERYYRDRIAVQRSVDAHLSRAISLLLDDRDPILEVALKSAEEEFHRSDLFLEQHSGVMGRLVEDDGKVSYRRLVQELGGTTKDVDDFVRELHLSRAAIAIRRKALIADAAALALADPDNPYMAMRKFLEGQVHQLEQADAAVIELMRELMAIELKGGWNNRKKMVAERQERFRSQISRRSASDGDEGDVEVLFLASESGELFQLLPADENELTLDALAEQSMASPSDDVAEPGA
ncbi:MAG: hypothetical protein R2735_04410 [Microthrixaceae bacterium]